MHAALHSAPIDLLESPRIGLQKADQLRCRSSQPPRGGRDVELIGKNDVECFGQQGCKVFMRQAHTKRTSVTTRLPAATRYRLVATLLAHPERQIDAQSGDGDTAVFVLAAPLGGLAANTGRSVNQHNGGFHFVSVLATGARSTLAAHITLLHERVRIQFAGMDRHGKHRSVDCVTWERREEQLHL